MNFIIFVYKIAKPKSFYLVLFDSTYYSCEVYVFRKMLSVIARECVSLGAYARFFLWHERNVLC